MTKFNELPYVAQIGIVTLLVIVLGVSVYVFKLEPLAKANKLDEQTLKSKQAEVAQLSPYKARLADLTAQINKLQVQIEAQKMVVPEEKEVPAFITLVENASVASGVEVRRYTPKPTVAKEYYAEAPFEVDVDGTYYSVLNFYDRLQKLERIVNVGGLQVGSLKAGGKAPVKKSYKWSPNETVAASALLTTYYSAPKAAPPAVAKK